MNPLTNPPAPANGSGAEEQKQNFKFNFAASINKTEQLVGEKKYIVNKDLYQNPFVNPFKAPPVPLSTEPHKVENQQPTIPKTASVQ